jgi:transposase
VAKLLCSLSGGNCHRAAARAAIEAAAGARHFLPTYSPDCNPIERAFAQLKAGLRASAGDGPFTGR